MINQNPPQNNQGNKNTLIGLVSLLMGIISLIIYLINANGDGMLNVVEGISLLFFILLVLFSVLFLIAGEKER